jgi:hypothetical protein
MLHGIYQAYQVIHLNLPTKFKSYDNCMSILGAQKGMKLIVRIINRKGKIYAQI